MKIRLLSSHVVDQIAAGEVVERPSHLVKELVENALDAAASSIEVEYDQGGRRIRVTDDGKGISSGELSLALARHATSKIKAAEDLWDLASFGFRGEALASIASVSRLSLTSRRRSDEIASRIVSEFGKISEAEPTGGNYGTTVSVEDLFANLPARLKFLKSEAGENAQIKATLKALALANPGVEFRIRSKGKLDSVWPRASGLLERARQILEAVQLYENQYSYEGYLAHVVFASPHDVTGNSRSIQIFVQDRWVQDRSLQAAVTEAYRGLLMHGEFPIAIVKLTAPKSEVDVNIHPTKSQVKFRDSQAAFRTVSRALRESLERAPWLITTSNRPGGGVEDARETIDHAPLGELESSSHPVSRKRSVAELTRPYDIGVKLEDSSSSVVGDSAAPSNTNTFDLQIKKVETNKAIEPSSEGRPNFALAPVNSMARFEGPEFDTILFRQKVDPSEFKSLDRPNEAARGPAMGSVGAWSRLQVLGQANLTYIIAQDEGRLVLIDQHAAHERVAYERLMRSWFKGDVEVQPLLLPLTLDLEPDGAEALVSVSAEIEKLGVQIDQIGPQSVAIRAIPAAIKETALARALSDLAREIVDRGGSFALERRISDLCATMACHSVVRAGQALSVEQMKSLLLQMDEFPLSSFCPHGRPVSVDYPFARLERDFGRLV